MKEESAKKTQASRESAVSTGSTLLNLACSDNTRIGFQKGGYYYMVGDSSSGKTFLSLTCMAEACQNHGFKDYRLIFDDVEGGALMDIKRFFGSAAADRMEPPAGTKDDPTMSDTVQSFYYHIADAIDRGVPFIYVLDSQDALESEAAQDKFKEQKKAYEKGKEATGSYGDGKAKYHSEHLRQVVSAIRKMGSILIIIGQTRENPNAMGFNPKTRAGGKALTFYCNLEIWSSVAGKIKRKVRDKDRTIGAKCLIEVRKNRVTGKIGKDRAVTIPIYYNLGIDDVGSCVDYLLLEKHWSKKTGGIVAAPEFGFSGTRIDLIQFIEQNGLERRLAKITGNVWRQIEAECAIVRKARYT